MPQDATTLFAQNEPAGQFVTMSSRLTADSPQASILWAKCLDIIRDNINPQVFRTWFENIRALSWNDSKL
ncbi:MAG: DnaA N-terminal domain-containing protein, partial [Candidatus Kapaibacteriota bacterium]